MPAAMGGCRCALCTNCSGSTMKPVTKKAGMNSAWATFQHRLPAGRAPPRFTASPAREGADDVGQIDRLRKQPAPPAAGRTGSPRRRRRRSNRVVAHASPSSSSGTNSTMPSACSVKCAQEKPPAKADTHAASTSKARASDSSVAPTATTTGSSVVAPRRMTMGMPISVCRRSAHPPPAPAANTVASNASATPPASAAAAWSAARRRRSDGATGATRQIDLQPGQEHQRQRPARRSGPPPGAARQQIQPMPGSSATPQPSNSTACGSRGDRHSHGTTASSASARRELRQRRRCAEQRSAPVSITSWSAHSLGEHQLHLEAHLPVGAVVRVHRVVVRAELRVHRQLAGWKILPTPPPSGTVHCWPLSAFQLTVAIGALVR